MHAVDALNALGAAWAGAMMRSLIDSSVLLALVLLVWFPLRRRISSQTTYGLFLLVLIKATVPLPIRLPAALVGLVPGSAADRLVTLPARVIHQARWEVTDDHVFPPEPSESFLPTVDQPSLTPPRSGSDKTIRLASPPLMSRPTVEPRPLALSTTAITMLAWAALAAGLLARLAWVHLRMSLRLHQAPALDPGTLTVDYDRLRERCGLKRPVPLLLTPHVSSPAVWGLIRPRLLMPPGLVESLPPGQLTWVILHELAHIRRRDTWVVLFQRLVQIAYVFHPVVWVANRLIDVQREYACDDVAIALADDVPRGECAAGFVAVIERASAREVTTSPALGLYRSHTLLRRRLMRILNSRRSIQRRLTIRAAVALAIAAVAVLPYVNAREQDQPPPREVAAPSVRSDDPIQPTTARELAIRVVRKDDGQPLAGATVEAKFYLEGYTDRLATTDADGRCTIAAPVADPSFMIIGASKEGFIPLRVSGDPQDDADGLFATHTFELTPGMPIGLRVQDEQGKPIADAKVVPWFMGKVGGAGKQRFGIIESAASATNADGRWQANVLPAQTDPKGKILFRLVHPDFASDRDGFSRELTIEEARAGTGILVMKAGLPVAGQVVDSAGKPVAGAAVALGFSNSDGDCHRTRTDADGRFRFAHVDAGERASLTLAVEAAGHAPAVQAIRLDAEPSPQVVQLGPATPFNGRVVDGEGQPVAGATVKLNRFDAGRHWTWKGETDADGRFTWPDGPSAGEVAFNVTKAPFTRAIGRSFGAGADAATITLHQALRLRGAVVDADTGKPIDAFTLIPGWGPDRPEGQVSWRRDGSAKRLKGGSYDELGLFPNQGLIRSLRVEADGYLPGVLLGFKDDAGELVHDFKLQKAAGLSGVIQGPDGKPLAGAKVLLTNRSFQPHIRNGIIDEFSRVLGLSAETGPDGRYAFQPQDEPSGIIILADEGFARSTPEQLAVSSDVRLEPWARVEGTCHVGTKPVAHQKIRLSVDATTDASTDYEFFEYEAETDEQGRFVVDRVVAGNARATTATPQGANRGPYGSIGSASFPIKAGETAQVAIGGRGRPVIGRLSLADENVLPLDLAEGQGTMRLKTDGAKMPLPIDFATWDPERRRAYSFAWFKTPEARAARRVMRGNGIRIESDGSFRAEEVLPGAYELTIQVGSDEHRNRETPATVLRASATREVIIPESPGGRTEEPLDLGTLVLIVDVKHYKALGVGQLAPDFTTQTLDGQPLRLADFRGRYLLLDFWATWCIPCLEQEPSLKTAFDAFGDDPRFAMLSLSLDAEPEAPKAYLAKRQLAWTQGFLGDWSTTTIPADYGVLGIPSIWLIGPDGRVVAKDLRGGAIKAAVADALGRK